ncbi:MAG TPA: hypothetical protein VG126_06535 [Thermoleophilaceae bacterium]|nr:hypothetical protein [Thermoleophilaceae bacterium]
MRKKTVLGVIGLAVAVAMTLPASAVAKPNIWDRFEARQACISERGVGDPVKMMQFKMLYGRRPMRKCVRMHARLVAMENRFEVPMIRMECRLMARTDPEFRLEFPSVRACVRMEMMP